MRRHETRRRAMKVLYEAALRSESAEEALRRNYPGDKAHPYLRELVEGAGAYAPEADSVISRLAHNWDLARIPPVDKMILRIALYELARTDLPPAVVIDEAVELAKEFSTDASGAFVNGILSAAVEEGLRGTPGQAPTGTPGPGPARCESPPGLPVAGPGETVPGDVVLPAYGRRSVAELSSWLRGSLGEEPAGGISAELPRTLQAKRIVLFVVDGVGTAQLEEYKEACPFISSLPGAGLTSTFPSTTGAALTSLTTGVPPGEHGLVGYSFLTDAGLLNVLKYEVDKEDARDALSPRILQPRWTIFDELADRAIPSWIVSKARFEGTGFSEAFLRGASWAGWEKTSEIPGALSATLERMPRGLIYAYFDEVDHAGHEYGVGSNRYLERLHEADSLAERISGLIGAGDALVVCSDHGAVQVEPGKRAFIEADVADLCRAIGGEGRARYLYAEQGREEELAAAAEESYSSWAWVLSREELRQAGWLGPSMSDPASSRVGDVLVAAREVAALIEPGRQASKIPLGHHGSLTAAEMEVPLRIAAS